MIYALRLLKSEAQDQEVRAAAVAEDSNRPGWLTGCCAARGDRHGTNCGTRITRSTQRAPPSGWQCALGLPSSKADQALC
jgi:hypothetical protein